MQTFFRYLNFFKPIFKLFKGQGYCMSGDSCPYDHGEDPVVMKLGSKPNYMSNSNLLTPPNILSTGGNTGDGMF